MNRNVHCFYRSFTSSPGLPVSGKGVGVVDVSAWSDFCACCASKTSFKRAFCFYMLDDGYELSNETQSTYKFLMELSLLLQFHSAVDQHANIDHVVNCHHI
ncbi:unnamed protein product [Mucor fragilis]